MYVCVFQKLDIQKRVLDDVVIPMLGSDDPRVRHAAAGSLIKYVLHHLAAFKLFSVLFSKYLDIFSQKNVCFLLQYDWLLKL